MSDTTVLALERRVASLRWTTALVLAGFLLNAGLIVLLVAAVSGSVIVSLSAVGVMAVVIGCAALYSDRYRTSATGARPLRPDEYPWLTPMVHELSVLAAVPPPSVLVSEDEAMNAYATGLGRRSQVVFTQGLLAQLPRNEVRAVAAHEIGHVANRDIRLMVWTGAIFFWVSTVSTILIVGGHGLWGLAKGASETGDDALGVAAGWCLAFLAGLCAVFTWVLTFLWSSLALALQAAISRQREHLADATAVALTGRPQDFANALARIEDDPYLRQGARQVRHYAIHSPLLHAGWSDRLYSSHPSTPDRVRAVTALPVDGEVSLADEHWQGLGSSALFVPAGAVLALAGLAILFPLLSGGGGDAGGPYQSNVPVSGGGPARNPGTSVSGATARPATPPSPGRAATPTPAAPTNTPTPVARELSYGQGGLGQIASPDGVELWEFLADQGDIVTIRVVQQGSASLHPAFELLDGSGARLQSGAGGHPCDTTESLLQNYALPHAGTYRIRVAGGCDSVGGYTIQLSLKAPPAAISFGQTVAGAIGLAGDYQEWTFKASTGDIITILGTQQGSVSLRPVFSVFDPGGARVADGVQSGTHPCDVSKPQLLNERLLFDGVYRIRVSGNCRTTGGFQLQLLLKPPPGQLLPGQRVLGTIARAGDYEDWTFQGTAGQIVSIRMGREGNASLAPTLSLLDSKGTKIRDGGESGTHPCDFANPRLELTLPYTGAYTVRALANCSTSGGYNLTLAKQ